MNILIEEFRNNVFCRNESNQHKAKKLWKEISKDVNEKEKMLFSTEWNHYLIGEITTKEFEYFLNYILNKNLWV